MRERGGRRRQWEREGGRERDGENEREKMKSGKLTKDFLLLRYAAVELELVLKTGEQK